MRSADASSQAHSGDVVPVTHARHGARFWRRFTSWDFARAQRLVPIVLGEHEQVAASLPILFMHTGAGLWPVALTRLRVDGPCALISPEGRWRGSYVPSILRVHPFAARRTETGDVGLLVDEASGLVTDDPADEPFFAEEGTPAPPLAQVLEFFRERTIAENRTRAAMAEIVARSGLVPFRPPEGLEKMDAKGLFMPDRARIDHLGRTALGALHGCGALGLVQAQAVSVHHLPFFAAAEAQFGDVSRPPPMGPDVSSGKVHGGPEVPGLSGFLDALAESRDRDCGDPGAADDKESANGVRS